MNKQIQLPITKEIAKELRAGESVLLSGYMYVARDAAHKRFVSDGKTPFDITDAVIYYAGPTPAKIGMACGSCGPTTSARMNPYAPDLLEKGLCAIIGKGEMSDEVKAACVENKALYLCATGGAGALYAKCIDSVEVIAYDDLGCESVKKMHITDFPVIVAFDTMGDSVFV